MPHSKPRRRKWYRRYYSGVYVIMGHHPEPKWFTPYEVVLYVGKSTQHPLEKRITQHRRGSSQYDKPPAPWSDLYTRHYWAKRGKMFTLTLAFREFWQIQRLHPIANDKMNRHNPRHIPIWRMRELRALRDQGVRPKRLADRTQAEMGVHVKDGKIVGHYGPGWKVS